MEPVYCRRMSRPIVVLMLLLLGGSSVAAQTFTEDVWRSNADTYHAIIRHPFLEQMQAGTLDRDLFAAYLVQDARYLGVFARALRALASKAPRPEWARHLEGDAQGSLAEERRLQDRLLETYGIGPAQLAEIEPSPDAFAYSNYLLATVYDRPFAEGVAALLPCYWIYWEVGKELAKTGSPDPVYQAWIEANASSAYGTVVEAILTIANAVAAEADAATVERMQEHFRRASRYEWLFWDSAFHQRTWPLDELHGSAPAPSAQGREF